MRKFATGLVILAACVAATAQQKVNKPALCGFIENVAAAKAG
jgi:hypothetical protein